jgi:hypothetical protein
MADDKILISHWNIKHIVLIANYVNCLFRLNYLHFNVQKSGIVFFVNNVHYGLLMNSIVNQRPVVVKKNPIRFIVNLYCFIFIIMIVIFCESKLNYKDSSIIKISKQTNYVP